MVAFVHWHTNFVSSVGVQKIEMITAKESKQAAKGRMQMYQPAQRLARGNAGGETHLVTGQKILWFDLRAYLIYKRAKKKLASLIFNINDNGRRGHEKPETTEPNDEFLMITVEMLMLMIVMVMKKN